MTVKAGRYIWKKIGSSMVPVRKGLEIATKEQSSLAKLVNSGSFKNIEKLGSGVDFTAYRMNGGEDVIKTLKKWGRKTTSGTSNHRFIKKWPELGDKLAVTKALADNLPNYGIPTLETEIIRINKNKRGILQRFIQEKPNSFDNGTQWLIREGKKISADTGLDIDAHWGNIRNGRLIDSGGNLKKSLISRVKHNQTAKELLGIETYYGTEVKSLVNKSTVMSEEALLNGQSKGILAKLTSMKKKGFKFFKKANSPDEYRLINAVPTKNQKISRDTIRFIRRRGRIIPIRTKK